MKLRSDKSGQVMLATAFLLAITLTFIALMLNNVIYYNNISYTGFMDQAYDDNSIKNIVTKAAISAYNDSLGVQSAFEDQMRDLAKSLNNGTLSEGSYVVISPPTFFELIYSSAPSTPYHSTTFDLTIYSKGLSKTYSIQTSQSASVTTPGPIPGPMVLDCKVTIWSPDNNSIVYQGGTNHTYILVTVKNSTNYAVPHQQVTLHTLKGIFYHKADGTRPVDDVGDPAVTDETGTIPLYWFPLPGDAAEGVDVINAGTGFFPTLADGNRSNNVIFKNKKFIPCGHIVTLGTTPIITKKGTNGNPYVTISIPVTGPAGAYNFSRFTVGSVVSIPTGGNVNPVPSTDLGNYTEPDYLRGSGDYHRDINIDLYPDRKQNNQFTVVITVIVDAYCNLDEVPCPTIKSTYTVPGTWS